MKCAMAMVIQAAEKNAKPNQAQRTKRRQSLRKSLETGAALQLAGGLVQSRLSSQA